MRRSSKLSLTAALGAAALLATAVIGPSAHAARDNGPELANIKVGANPHLSHAKAARPTSGSTANMTFHNGTVLTSAVTQNIFWGTSWASDTSDKRAGLDTFMAGYSGSRYAATSTEFTGTNGRVGTTVTHLGHVVDPTKAAGGGSTSAILAEVAKVVPNPVSNGVYFVYTDVPRGNAGYCAWHSYGTVNGVPVQFGFFFKLDGDAGCNPQDTSGLHSQGLAALANVTGHELAETFTDPRNGGWYDKSGYENADKCAWTWGAPLVQLSNGSQWKVQGEWSNAAYTAGTGYPNRSGQKGCLGGA